MLFGTLVGNFLGAVPGLAGNLGLALLIPFAFGMKPFLGLAFLLAMHSVVHTGGSIPGILFGIPGTGPTVATIVDGCPMTKQGKGGEAMGAHIQMPHDHGGCHRPIGSAWRFLQNIRD